MSHYNPEVGGYREDTTDATGKQKVEQTLARFRASSDWMRQSFWDEFQDAWQSYKCRTTPIYKRAANGEYLTDSFGNKIEDTSRTNVAMPDFFIAIRRKAVRKSRRPPTIRIRAKDPGIAAFLTHWCQVQWDRAGEQRIQRRHVLQGDLFGISLKMHWWNKISRTRQWRYEIERVLDRIYVRQSGNGMWEQCECDESGAYRAAELPSELQAQVIAALGPEVRLPEDVKRFEGPVSTLVFVGDWHPEPELTDIHAAAWHGFEEIVDAEWLAYWATQTYRDLETGEERRVISDKALRDLEECGPYEAVRGAGEDFRERLRDVLFRGRPQVEARLIPGARYLIQREFTFRKGVCWVRFVGNEKVFLGEFPLPWDLNGKYPLSAYCPIEDLLCAIGDSTPRIGRFLWKLHNVNIGQRTDVATNLAKPTLLVERGTDIPHEIAETGLFRILFVDDVRAFGRNIFEGIRVPAELYQHAGEIVRLIQQLEPAIIDFGEQTQALPESRRVATIAMLQNRATESLSSDELEALNTAIADETEIKIEMLQEMQTETLELAGLVPPAKDTWIWSIETRGGPEHPRKTRATPYELQVDFEVEPEFGSTLALDDQFRLDRYIQLYQLAVANPLVWNVREAARLLAARIAGPEGANLVKPEPPPAQPAGPEVKASLSIAWKDLEPHIKAQLLARIGIEPPPDLQLLQSFDLIRRGRDAAEDAQKLMEEPQPDSEFGGMNR